MGEYTLEYTLQWEEDTMASRPAGGDRGYTTVAPNGSPGYVAPYEPACPATQRYMAVHRIVGGGWGIVDRRTLPGGQVVYAGVRRS